MNWIITGPTEHDYLKWRYGMARTVEIIDIQTGSKRRRGIGRGMISKFLDQLVKGTDHPNGITMVYAITRISNTVAHQFYEALGFRIVGRLHYFYREGPTESSWEHALMYGLDI